MKIKAPGNITCCCLSSSYSCACWFRKWVFGSFFRFSVLDKRKEAAEVKAIRAAAVGRAGSVPAADGVDSVSASAASLTKLWSILGTVLSHICFRGMSGCSKARFVMPGCCIMQNFRQNVPTAAGCNPYSMGVSVPTNLPTFLPTLCPEKGGFACP